MDSTAADGSSSSLKLDISPGPSEVQDSEENADETAPVVTMGLLQPLKTFSIKDISVNVHIRQLTDLETDNFKLRFKISSSEDDMVHMTNVHQAKVESLKNEISDKQRLVCLASKAMDLMGKNYEENLKEIRQQNDTEERILKSRIQELETALKENENKLRDSASSVCRDGHTLEGVEAIPQYTARSEAQVKGESLRKQPFDEQCHPLCRSSKILYQMKQQHMNLMDMMEESDFKIWVYELLIQEVMIAKAESLTKEVCDEQRLLLCQASKTKYLIKQQVKDVEAFRQNRGSIIQTLEFVIQQLESIC
ncbi:uncharacterized protein LOC110836007 isoform X2 [Zootermopsis nevadensis]|uniref:uncharacterized protein LOC110836007 isoform X2 n=1 Tax=Zootermopsis nevadensis TaxID=136037 RepID=UPI000B8E5455|nr:uncharacterized protein LOC110836007 isoform X2 [Zootermopsis nevadensis]